MKQIEKMVDNKTRKCDKYLRFDFLEGNYHKTLAHLHGHTGKLNTQDLKSL